MHNSIVNTRVVNVSPLFFSLCFFFRARVISRRADGTAHVNSYLAEKRGQTLHCADGDSARFGSARSGPASSLERAFYLSRFLLALLHRARANISTVTLRVYGIRLLSLSRVSFSSVLRPRCQMETDEKERDGRLVPDCAARD